MSDDERARERAVILRRRAQLIAYAVAAGVATASCSGKTSSVCLSIRGTAGAGGVPVTTGGRGYCLSMPLSGNAGVGSGGIVSVCLTPPIVGGSPDPGAGGAAAGEGGAGGEGGTAPGGSGGSSAGTPMICLTPPR
jgi:hypothetical protein